MSSFQLGGPGIEPLGLVASLRGTARGDDTTAGNFFARTVLVHMIGDTFARSGRSPRLLTIPLVTFGRRNEPQRGRLAEIITNAS